MKTVFLPALMETAAKKSGDLAAKGSVCLFSINDLTKHHIKTMAGSFLPPYIKIRKNEGN